MTFKTWTFISVVTVMFISQSYGQGLQIALDFGQQALHVHHINKHAQKYSEQSNSVANTLFQETLYDDVAARVEDVLATNRSYDVSPLCLNQTEKILQGILERENWALRFIDAMGKPPSGLLDFNLVWLGSYDECLAGESQDQSFKGKYCRTFLSLGGQGQSLLQPGAALSIGLCVPDTCSAADANALANTLLSLLPLNTTTLPPLYSMCDEELEYDGKAIFVIVVISLFLVVMVTATTFDLYITFWVNQADQEDVTKKDFKYGGLSNGHVAETERTPLLPEVQTSYNRNSSVADYKIEESKSHQDKYEPGILGKLLLSFSVYTNCRKILSTRQPSGTLTAVNGIRFISMTWVILGHTYAFGLSAVENLTTFLPRMLKRFTFQAIGNATVAVDTFFVLSGLLVAYLSLREMRKKGGAKKFSWGMFYFHRFWRLTPPYMLFLMLYVPTIKYWSRGPLWPQQGVEFDECSDSWWHNLLYINNVYEPEKMCMAWSWYLANDMQFYVISPLMLVPLYYSPLWGTVSCFLMVLLGSISTGAISKHYSIGANMLLGNDGGESFNEIYVKPWCRVGPYAVGFFTGYLLYYTDCKFRMPKLLNMAGWALSTGVAILVLYGLYTPDGGSKLGVDTSALYNATFRVAWAMCICWVIFACATGNGGPVNTLLSWRAIIPLSRLTYCAYLVHPVVMYVYYLSRHTLMYWQDIEMIYLFLAHACLSYAVALVISLGFESPMMGLEKVLLGRAKQS